jgi:hypothetical protein
MKRYFDKSGQCATPCSDATSDDLRATSLGTFGKHIRRPEEARAVLELISASGVLEGVSCMLEQSLCTLEFVQSGKNAASATSVMHSTLPMLEFSSETLAKSISALLSEMDNAISRVLESSRVLDGFAELNASVACELEFEGCTESAAGKRFLSEAEKSLVYSVQSNLFHSDSSKKRRRDP